MMGCYGTSGYYFAHVMEEALFFLPMTFIIFNEAKRRRPLFFPLLLFSLFLSFFLYTIHGETLKVDPAVVLTKIDPYPGAERRLCAAIPLDCHKKMRLCECLV